MSNRRLTIWCNNDFTEAQQRELDLLRQGVGSHRLLMMRRNDPEARQTLPGADIAFGTPDAQAVCESPNVRWVQLNSAGYTSSEVYAEPCAQHLLAMITSLARGLPAALDAQRGDHSWRYSLRPSLPLLNQQTVLILGWGAIARRLVDLLRPLEMNLVAVRRQVKGDEPIRVVSVSELDALLPTVDHLVNTFPQNGQTEGFVNAARLASLKAGAIFYNIGRGTTVDQSALIKELREGRLAAAYLDVTDPEPLPP